MSRIGNAPITVPEGVEISQTNGVVTVKGKKGELSQEMDEAIAMKVEDNTITFSRSSNAPEHFTFSRSSNAPEHRSKHGLYRALLNNMIIGVSEGWKKELQVIGVGYRAVAKGQLLELALGYSHAVILEIPSEIKVSTVSEKGKAPIVTLESHDKQLVGQVASKIRSLRKPEPYKGKGVRYMGEEVRRKAGKAAAKK